MDRWSIRLRRIPANCPASFRRSASEERFLIETRIHRHVEEPDHHLLPALLAEVNLRGGVGVEWVVRGVVKVSGAEQPRTGGKQARLLQLISQLPPEIVVA